MKAVMVDEPGKVRVVDVPEPEPGPDDVVVRVGACGICGTDIHIIDGEFPPTVYPIVIGHEFGGEVTAVGENVNGFSVGDRVGVDPTLNCGACYYCQRGMGNLCERWNAVGVGHHPGGFAEYVSRSRARGLPHSRLHVDEGRGTDRARLLRGARLPSAATPDWRDLSHLRRGTDGPAQRSGRPLQRCQPGRADRHQPQPARASQDDFGFEHVATNLEDLKDIAPRGFDNVIEATGVTKVAEAAIDAVKRRGKLLLFGVCPPGEKAGYDAFKIYNEEISILGTMAVLNSYGPAIDILTSGAIDTERMVSDTYTLEQFPEAVAHVRSGTGLKVQVAGTFA